MTMKEKESNARKTSILFVTIAILVLVLLLAIGDMGPFADGKPPGGDSDPGDNLNPKAIDTDLIVSWGKERPPLDVSSIVKDLKKNGIPGQGEAQVESIAFHKSDGTVFVADMKGMEILPCAGIVDGKIVPISIKDGMVMQEEEGEICDNLTDTKIIGLSESITIHTIKNPDCRTRSYNGTLVERCRR